MKKLTTILVCILVCVSVFAKTPWNTVVTGEISLREHPCWMAFPHCPDTYVIQITNDTASFVLTDGWAWDLFDELDGFSIGDTITIYGNYYKAEGYIGEDFYFLHIVSIVNNNAIKSAVVTGRLTQVCSPHDSCLVPYIWIVETETDWFYLTIDGQMFEWELPNTPQFEGFSQDDSISVYGIVNRIELQGIDRIWYHYELEVFTTIRTGIVTGRLGTAGRPCPIGFGCTADMVPILIADNAAFVLKGKRVNEFHGLNSPHRFGDTISIYGTYYKAIGYLGGVFYYLEIIEILNNDTSEREINIHQIQISPNPTDGQITISGIENFDNATFELFDLSGSLIQSGVLAPTINLSALQGIYLLTITQNQRVIAQERIVVK